MVLKHFVKLFSKGRNMNNLESKEVEDFKNTLNKLPSVKEIYGDSFDTFLDTAREKGLYEEVPLFGGVIRLTRKAVDTYAAFNSYRFCKKAYTFLVNTKDINRDDFNKLIQEYSEFTNEDGYELLLSVIDRIDNINKAEILGNLFKAKVEGNITIEDYVRLCSTLQQVPYVDLRYLPSYIKEREEGRDSFSLLASGLIVQTTIDANGPSMYQLNDNGVLMTKNGLDVDVEVYERGNVKVKGVAEPIPTEEIDKILNE